MEPAIHPLLALGGVFLSVFLWIFLLRGRPGRSDGRLTLVYLAALAGAFLGAKLIYLAAEGWLHLPGDGDSAAASAWWWHWLAGKSILGALLGGYAAVEITKRGLGYASPTGDLFAVVVPAGLLVGRAGCLLHGCCPGVPLDGAWYTLRDAHGIARWPAVPVELGFNAVFLLFAVVALRRRLFAGQPFHLYLIAYGLFRFAHEFLRDTPRLLGPLSGYHAAALGVLALGALRHRERRRGSQGTRTPQTCAASPGP
jgi:phosphatidylglycerol:prolipoprotein diacylglycerol transferase